MIRVGKDEVEDRLGVRLKSFVAGRWSFNNYTIRALIERRTPRDCSAVAHDQQAHHDWYHDWSRLPRISIPYHPSTNDYQSLGDLPQIVIPIAQMVRFGSVNPERAPASGLLWLKACFRECLTLGLLDFHLSLRSFCTCDSFLVRELIELLEYVAWHLGVEMTTASEVGACSEMTAQGRYITYLTALRLEVLSTGIAASSQRLGRS